MAQPKDGDKLPVKLSSVVGIQRYVPNTSQSSLVVAVRVRPLLKAESTGRKDRRDIIRNIDGKIVVVLDPDESKDYLDQVQNRTKEKRYTFDVAFDTSASNVDVYNGTVRDLVSGVLYGVNTTVFAYGATGSGKTYTMVGNATDPGLMVLSLQRIFQDRDRFFSDEEFSVTCTYLEVYNEVIYDLLVKNSGPLELREDPDQGVQVAGLKHISVASAEDILDLLEEGNKRRKTESTDANSQSSRSHAVLEITIKRSPKNHYRVQQLRAKLSLVDLAGSERAAETNNDGRKLRDGANINRSLLALANCINALGKASGQKGASYIPYRNSKLTRLLKDGLSGNSRTCMIATVAAASDQYHHSINTLKYADRAKEIKTHVVQNVGTVESHIADYQRIIDNLQVEVQDLKLQLQERATPPPGVVRGTDDELLGLIDSLVQDMNENIEERINLQKAVFEIEDANLYNRYEVKQLEEFLDKGQGSAKDIVEARDRKSDIEAAIKDNNRELSKFKQDIAANEEMRKEIQGKIDKLVNSNQNVAFLNLMSTFRLQAVRVQELKFQVAVRDQIISEQREVISNLWRIIDKSGMGRQRVLDIAKQEGIIMDGVFQLTEGPPGVGDGGGNAEDAGSAALDGHASTPNSSLVGNRAKMRYRFWAQYNGEMAGGPDGGDAAETASVSSAVRGSARRPKGGAAQHQRKPERELPSARRRGAGVRVEHVAHMHPNHPAAGRRRRTGVDPAQAKRSSDGAVDIGSPRSGRGGPGGTRSNAGTSYSGSTTAGARSAPGASALSGAVAAVIGAGGSNMTVPTVRSGRRAGMPAAHQRSNSDEQLFDLASAAGDAVSAADFAFDLPRAAYGRGPSEDGGTAAATAHFMPGAVIAAGGALSFRRRPTHAHSMGAASAQGAAGATSAAAKRQASSNIAWGEAQGGGARPTPLPPVPPAQAPLNERLARLKGRVGGGLGRRSDADGLQGLPSVQDPGGPSSSGAAGGAGGLAPSEGAESLGVVGRAASRSSLAAAAAAAAGTGTSSAPAGDSLDQMMSQGRRLSSAGSVQ